MAESYCLKSCTECGREGCAGCKAGAFAQQCAIVKCCKEKNHASCESCTRGINCPTRSQRDQMPERIFALQRREAELAVKYRDDAALMAKWTKMVFWCLMAGIAVGLLEIIPALATVGAVIGMVPVFCVAYGFYRMKPVAEGFGTAAVLVCIDLVLSGVQMFFEEGRFVYVLLNLVIAVCGFFRIKLLCESMRDSLSGIHREMSEKWENQWLLEKIGLWIILGSTVAMLIPFISLIGALGILAGAGVLLFNTIREYVYLWQTAKICEEFA